MESHEETKTCYICQKSLNTNILMMKIYEKLITIIIILVNTRYSIPNEIHVAFHNGFHSPSLSFYHREDKTVCRRI